MNIRQLALDVCENKVFGSWMFSSKEELESLLSIVFSPILFLENNIFDELKKAAHIYEYYDKAIGSRSINGYPIFMSFHCLSEDQFDELITFCQQIEQQRKSFLEEGN